MVKYLLIRVAECDTSDNDATDAGDATEIVAAGDHVTLE